MMKRYLILEDGTVFQGTAFGADVEKFGEVVFTTGMTGYQEAITDQSYADQLLVFTNPLIGNYGVNIDDYESLDPQCSGVICQEVARVATNWRMQDTLPNFLKNNGIPGISGIDTRKLTKILREEGSMKGCIVNSGNVEEGLKRIKEYPYSSNLVPEVSTTKAYPNPGTKRNIVLVDYGVKHSILRELAKRGCSTIVLPYTATAEDVLRRHPDGVLLSNGPGDPAQMGEAVKMAAEVEKHVPVFGICLGHQILAQANGAKTYKMKFGHRGFNHPVREIATGRIMFTSQNHGYAVDPDSIDPEKLIVTHEEINDGTIEGIKHRHYPAFSVQFHPDAAPGPLDAVDIFDDFMQIIDRRKEANKNA